MASGAIGTRALRNKISKQIRRIYSKQIKDVVLGYINIENYNNLQTFIDEATQICNSKNVKFEDVFISCSNDEFHGDEPLFRITLYTTVEEENDDEYEKRINEIIEIRLEDEIKRISKEEIEERKNYERLKKKYG